MTTVNYSSPVMVNGFACKNCTDVDNARKHIDPQNPKNGPYGLNAKDQPPGLGVAQSLPSASATDPASTVSVSDRLVAERTATQGHHLDILV